MRGFVQFLLSSSAASVAAVAVWLISFAALEVGFLLSSVYALLGGGGSYVSLKGIMQWRFLRHAGLSRREYKYIKQNLKEARTKIGRLQKAFLRVKSIPQAKENLEIWQTVRSIYRNTKREPRRFYQAEPFFYSHLDSLVELAEKHAYLASQPSPSKEMIESLAETRRTISGMGEMVRKDLHIMLNDDMNTLHMEMDVAKQSKERKLGNKDRRLLK